MNDHDAQVLITGLTDARRETAELRAELERLADEIKRTKRIHLETCDPPIPEPPAGSDLARLVIANRLLRGDVADLRSEVERLSRQNERLEAMRERGESLSRSVRAYKQNQSDCVLWSSLLTAADSFDAYAGLAALSPCGPPEAPTKKTCSPSDRDLRKLLWLRHGCPFSSLYGDDGEMQCSSCQIDFGRASPDSIRAAFERIGLAACQPPEAADRCETCHGLGQVCDDEGAFNVRPCPACHPSAPDTCPLPPATETEMDGKQISPTWPGAPYPLDFDPPFYPPAPDAGEGEDKT